MGSINVCNESRSSLKKSNIINKIILEVDLNFKDMKLILISGYCAFEKCDVIINISDEYISGAGTEQELTLFSQGGKEISQEAAEFIAKHQKLHHKLPFYTHGGNLAASHVIHATLSEDKNIIGDAEIQKSLVDCFLMADQELEANCVSLPMFSLRNISLSRISKIVMQSIKTYLEKVQKKYKNPYLNCIKLIGEEPKMQIPYIQAAQNTFVGAVKYISVPRKVSDQLGQMYDYPMSIEDQQVSYIPSFNSEKQVPLNQMSKDFQIEEF